MIRRARASDIAEVSALYHAVWHESQAPFMPPEEIIHRSMEFFVARMTVLLNSTLVTEQDGEIAAFSAWRGHLLGQLFVAAPHRAKGIASRLLRASEIEMANEGTAEAELHCVVGKSMHAISTNAWDGFIRERLWNGSVASTRKSGSRFGGW
jgi:hypothetical protein